MTEEERAAKLIHRLWWLLPAGWIKGENRYIVGEYNVSGTLADGGINVSVYKYQNDTLISSGSVSFSNLECYGSGSDATSLVRPAKAKNRVYNAL